MFSETDYQRAFEIANAFALPAVLRQTAGWQPAHAKIGVPGWHTSSD